jgi:hypothetical protein
MLTPNDLLENLRDSVHNAALRYEDGDIVLIFATPKQVQAINIALGKIVPETIKDRALRITLLADIAGRSTRTFRSSKDLTLPEASALIDRLYNTAGSEVISLAHAELRSETVSAIQYAYAALKEGHASPA